MSSDTDKDNPAIAWWKLSLAESEERERRGFFAPLSETTGLNAVSVRFTGPHDEGRYWMHLSDGAEHSSVQLPPLHDGAARRLIRAIAKGPL